MAASEARTANHAHDLAQPPVHDLADDLAYDVGGQPASELAPGLKAMLFAGIRFAHRALSPRSLEGKISIYFHALDRSKWDQFRACIEHFKGLGYHTVSPPEFVTTNRRERCLFVSFDDNFRDWHAALPLLRSLGIHATFYVNSLPFRDVEDSDTIARYSRRLRLAQDCEPLTRDELRQIRAEGHTIGCHSHSHFVLGRLPRELWDGEIRGSKEILEAILGEEVSDFSWPYGMRRHFSDDLRDYCRSIGFRTITNAISGCQAIAGDDPLDIYRTDWRLDTPLQVNLANLRIDGRLYARITGRSVIGR